MSYMLNTCVECGKLIRSNAKRCTECYLKYLSKSKNCINCGKKISSQAEKCRRCSKLGHGWPKKYYKKQSLAQKNRFKNNHQWNEGKHWKHLQGKNHGQWKGNKVGIKALHRWVINHKGRPKQCDQCQTTNKKVYDWANKDHKYKRDLSDYIRLCRSCHRKYDYKLRIGII